MGPRGTYSRLASIQRRRGNQETGILLLIFAIRAAGIAGLAAIAILGAALLLLGVGVLLVVTFGLRLANADKILGQLAADFTMAFELPELPYDYEALQPFMSKETLEFHHDKHHKAYVDNGNKLAAEAGLADLSLEDVVKKSFGTNAGLFNNAAQHYNHVHFWKWMKKGGGGNKLPGKLEAAFNSDLGGYDKFKADFVAAGTTQFGSGWAWVSVKNGKLEISKTPNGENPLVHGATPILGVDVWEHSYYIDYRNARPKYLEAFVDSLINWDYVLERYEAATK
jgi:Fe-Mn family superoxide dismutase